MADAGMSAARRAAYRKVPALKGVKPTVSARGDRRVFTFSKRVETSPGGPAIQQVVKVTVGPDDHVQKVVMGR